eukprot:9489853-Ditylum_brightwellii.AAC.1
MVAGSSGCFECMGQLPEGLLLPYISVIVQKWWSPRDLCLSCYSKDKAEKERKCPERQQYSTYNKHNKLDKTTSKTKQLLRKNKQRKRTTSKTN